MPTYEYVCPHCTSYTTGYRSVADRKLGPHCDCGTRMEHAILTAPAAQVQPEAHYECPVTGEQVTSWRQRKNLFAKHDLIDANEVGKDTFKSEWMAKKAKRDELAKDYMPPELKSKLKKMGTGNAKPIDNFVVE